MEGVEQIDLRCDLDCIELHFMLNRSKEDALLYSTRRGGDMRIFTVSLRHTRSFVIAWNTYINSALWHSS